MYRFQKANFENKISNRSRLDHDAFEFGQDVNEKIPLQETDTNDEG